MNQFSMPSQPESEVADALLNFVQHGAFPDKEEVISARLSSPILSITLRSLQEACQEATDQIKNTNGGIPPSVDDWANEARRLVADIRHSETTAQEVTELQAEWQGLEEALHDVNTKYIFLQNELAFNRTLAQTCRALQEVKDTINDLEETLGSADYPSAVRILSKIEAELDELKWLDGTAVLNIIRERTSELRKATSSEMEKRWNEYIMVDIQQRRICIKASLHDKTSADFESLIKAIDGFGALSPKLDDLGRDVQRIASVLTSRSRTKSSSFVVQPTDGSAHFTENRHSSDVHQGMTNLVVFLDYLDRSLPSSFAAQLSNHFMPGISSMLISRWLSPSVPVSVESLAKLNDLCTKVTAFRDVIKSKGWQGEDEITDWLENISQVWLSKRREYCLKTMRNIMLRKIGPLRLAERTETQRISSDDTTVLVKDLDQANGNNGNHNAQGPLVGDSLLPLEADEGALGAWGFEDEATTPTETHHQDEPQDTAKAWGFGEEEEEDISNSGRQVSPDGQTETSTAGQPYRPPSAQEMTLRETYTVSDESGEIFTILNQLLLDSMKLMSDDHNLASSSIAPAAAGLPPISTLVLATYRALSLYHYQKQGGGRMLQYNDSFWLGMELRKVSAQAMRLLSNLDHGSTLKTTMDSNIAELETFGKNAYKMELESQRSRLSDILSATKGFENCTAEPYASRCEDAVTTVARRIRDLHNEWSSILSRSTLLQSIGSLISHVTNVIVTDIEDMADISEVESQELARLCAKISDLEDLFKPQDASTSSGQSPSNSLPLTAIYTPNWFRFQFLVNILESSLADIRYLWVEGELKLEFSVEEVTDLIEALFTESDQRRRTISEIRRSSKASL